ncbi:MAG TPA: zf-TFIIB domain-containing protein [Thermoanaerobaculia bacterium]|nr:zf-TFIIB domain-containing protein [Thermoanaerobaculia bacterium]
MPRSRFVELLEVDLPPAETHGANDEEGGQCPQDRAIMARARIEVETERPIHLERCSTCRGVWFDGGEWQVLANHHLLEHLDEFWTADWRAKQRRELNRSEYESRVRESFGPQLYDQLLAVAKALRAHPRRSQALAIIREESES